jgi:hypothetical protein
LAWHVVQFVNGSTVAAVWQVTQVGADERGEVPETAWQGAQLPSKPTWFTPVWVDPVNGTAWFGPPGPPEWQAAPLNVEEKQLGAVLSGPVPGPSTLWQMAQDTSGSPAFLCDAA